MIRAVTFDWWHTLAVASPEFDERMRELRVWGIARVLAAHGVRIDPSVLFDAYDRHTEYLVGRWKELVDPPPQEQIASFLRFAGLDGFGSELVAAIAQASGGAIRERPPPLYPSVPEALAHLKGMGVSVGLVSNTGRTWGRYLRPLQDDLGIGRYFDVRIFSDEVGVRKPDARIFEAATRALGLRPDEIVHVGDDPIADVTGAKAFGMRAVWYNSGSHEQHTVRLPADAAAARPDAEVTDHAAIPILLEAWAR